MVFCFATHGEVPIWGRFSGLSGVQHVFQRPAEECDIWLRRAHLLGGRDGALCQCEIVLMNSVRGFSEAVDSIYEAALTFDVWPTALDAIASCLESKGCVLVGRRGDEALMSIVSPALEAASREYDEGAWRSDFMAQRAVIQGLFGDGSVLTPYNLATADERVSHPFFTDFRARHGLGEFLAMVLAPAPDVLVVLAMQGGDQRRLFSQSDHDVFSLLAQHVERALVITSRLIASEAKSAGLWALLDRLACGVVLIDSAGHVLSANPRAVAAMGGNSRLIADTQQHTGSVKYTDAGTSTLSPPRPVVMQGADGKRYAMYIVPVAGASNHAFHSLFPTVSHVVIFNSGETGSRPDPTLVRDLLDITFGEARLASLLSSGVTLRRAAEELGITESSARTVLKRIFAKTQTSRQLDLTAKIQAFLRVS